MSTNATRRQIAAALGGVLLGTLTTDALAGVFPPLPDVVVCAVDDPLRQLPWDRVVFYISVRLKDGGRLYKSLTSNPLLLTIDEEGRVEADGLEDCDGFTAEALRRNGQAFDFR